MFDSAKKTALIVLLCLASANAWGQLKEVGDIAEDFEVPAYPSGESLRLSDYQGSVIVLDFFFYW